jgi:hypothetical protein
VLAAAQERADAELCDGGGEMVSEARQGKRAAADGNDIGLFSDAAQRTEVGERVCDSRGEEGGDKTGPCAMRETGEGGRSAELLEQPEELVRRRPCGERAVLIKRQLARRGDEGLQEIDADEKAKRRELQQRGNPEEQRLGEQLRRKALNGEHAAIDECAGREHDDPVHGEEAKGVQRTADGWHWRDAEGKGWFTCETGAYVLAERVGEVEGCGAVVEEDDRGGVGSGIEEGEGGVASRGAIMPIGCLFSRRGTRRSRCPCRNRPGHGADGNSAGLRLENCRRDLDRHQGWPEGK